VHLKIFDTNRWYILSTKPRLETIASDNLKSQGHETLLPKITLNNKIKVLFPGYIFVKPNYDTSYISIKSTKGVKKFIKFQNIFPKVTEELIQFLKTNIFYYESLANNHKKYQKGQLLQVQRGPFKDFEVIFDSYDKDKNVFILLNFLERTQKLKLKESELY
jgi:transcriptional antiterminator RfaH